MKRFICKLMVLCICLTMFVSCGKEANNDPSTQLSNQTTATENKEPSMSILDINKLPEDTTPEYLNTVNLTQRDFYRKQINMSEGILAKDDTTFEVIESKEELDAFLKKGFYDDTLKSEGIENTFEEIYNSCANTKFFETSVLIVLGQYREYQTHVGGVFLKKHDGSYLIEYRNFSNIDPYYKMDGGFFGTTFAVGRRLFKTGTPIKDQIEIYYTAVN